eukprot:403337700
MNNFGQYQPLPQFPKINSVRTLPPIQFGSYPTNNFQSINTRIPYQQQVMYQQQQQQQIYPQYQQQFPQQDFQINHQTLLKGRESVEMIDYQNVQSQLPIPYLKMPTIPLNQNGLSLQHLYQNNQKVNQKKSRNKTQNLQNNQEQQDILDQENPENQPQNTQKLKKKNAKNQPQQKQSKENSSSTPDGTKPKRTRTRNPLKIQQQTNQNSQNQNQNSSKLSQNQEENQKDQNINQEDEQQANDTSQILRSSNSQNIENEDNIQEESMDDQENLEDQEEECMGLGDLDQKYRHLIKQKDEDVCDSNRTSSNKDNENVDQKFDLQKMIDDQIQQMQENEPQFDLQAMCLPNLREQLQLAGIANDQINQMLQSQEGVDLDDRPQKSSGKKKGKGRGKGRKPSNIIHHPNRNDYQAQNQVVQQEQLPQVEYAFEQSNQNNTGKQIYEILIEVASDVRSTSEEIKNQLQEAQIRIQDLATDVERITNSIIATLDQKITAQINYQEQFSKTEEGRENPEVQERAQLIMNDINVYSDRSLRTVRTMKDELDTFKNALQTINSAKVLKYTIEKDLLIQHSVVGVTEIPSRCGYDFMFQQLSEGLIAYSNKQIQQTDIVAFVPDTQRQVVEMKVVKSFGRAVNMIIQHEERILCDDHIYVVDEMTGTFNLMQNLDQNDITGAYCVSEKLIVFGHRKFQKLSIWQWDNDCYNFLQKGLLIKPTPNYTEYPITLMRRDMFSDLPNEIICVLNGFQVTRILMNGKDVSLSQKTKVWSNKRNPTIDYIQAEKDLFLIFYDTQVLMVDSAKHVKIRKIQFQHSQNIMIPSPKFNHNTMPVVFLQKERILEVLDVMGDYVNGLKFILFP